jgi:hypothetical protein
MTGVVFDRAPIVEVATQVIDEYDAAERMGVRAGDYLTDDFGSEYDLILACATLNMAKNRLDPLMARIRDALLPGGVLISLHDGLTEERTRPVLMVASILSSAMFGLDPAFEQGEIADSMRRAGFRSVESRTLETGVGPMDLDIARN